MLAASSNFSPPRGECAVVHSGQFMISKLSDSESDEDDSSFTTNPFGNNKNSTSSTAVFALGNVEDGRSLQSSSKVQGDQLGSGLNAVAPIGAGYDFGQSATRTPNYVFCHNIQTPATFGIDDSLTKLLECLTIAYPGKITSPKWNQFRGVKLVLKDKIRLNNIIWREYHMQYVKRKKPQVVQFAAPLTENHIKPEAVVMEGKYWKRRMDTICNEYKRWRVFFKSKAVKHDEKTNEQLLELVAKRDVRRLQNKCPSPDHLLEDIFMDFDNFDLFLEQPLAFPHPSDLRQLGNADIMQPGLIQLQPNLDDYTMDIIQSILQTSSASTTTVTGPSAGLPSVGGDVSDFIPMATEEFDVEGGRNNSTSKLMDTTSSVVLANSVGNSASGIPNFTTDDCSFIMDDDLGFVSSNNRGMSPVSDPVVGQTSNDSYLDSHAHQIRQAEPDMFVKLQPSFCPNFDASDISPDTPLQMQSQPIIFGDVQMKCQQRSDDTPNLRSALLQPSIQTLQQHQTAQQNQINYSFGLNSSSRHNNIASPGGATSMKQQVNYQQQPEERTLFKKPVQPSSSTTRSPQRTIHPTPDSLPPASHLPGYRFIAPSPSRSFQQAKEPLSRQLHPKAKQRTHHSPLKQDSVSSLNENQRLLCNTTNYCPIQCPQNSPTSPPTPTTPTSQQLNFQDLLAYINAARTGGSNVAAAGDRTTPSSLVTALQPRRYEQQAPSGGFNSTRSTSSRRFSDTAAQYGLSSGEQQQANEMPLNDNRIFNVGQRPTELVELLTSDSDAEFSLTTYPPSFAQTCNQGASQNMAYTANQVSSTSSFTSEHHPPTEVPSKETSHSSPASTSISSTQRSLSSATQCELARRININTTLEKLQSLLSESGGTMGTGQGNRVAKARLLHSTAEHVRHLRSDIVSRDEEIERIKLEIENLQNSISSCHSQLPATGVAVSRQRANQGREWFESFVRSSTFRNWKFYIFSLLISDLFDSYNTGISTNSADRFTSTVSTWLDEQCSLVMLRPLGMSALRKLSTSTSILTDASKVPEQVTQLVSVKNDSFPPQNQQTHTNFQDGPTRVPYSLSEIRQVSPQNHHPSASQMRQASQFPHHSTSQMRSNPQISLPSSQIRQSPEIQYSSQIHRLPSSSVQVQQTYLPMQQPSQIHQNLIQKTPELRPQEFPSLPTVCSFNSSIRQHHFWTESNQEDNS